MRNKEQEQFKKMTETPVSKLVVTLGIPTTISMLVTNIYNLADAHFVGKLGTSASGAVGVVFGLMSIIQAFGFMFGHGSGSIISRRLGEKDTDSTALYASTGFFYAFGTGVILTGLGLIFLDPLMRLLGSTGTILPYARTYGQYILLAAPFMAASLTMNVILRYEGKASLAMIGLMTGAVLNIFGDWFLIVDLNLGIAGAGIATAVSQLVSFLILLGMFLSGKTVSKLSIRKISRIPADVRTICATGFPSMMRQGLNSISTMILNNRAGLYGDAAIAAMTIVNRICFFVFAVALGIGQGFQPVSAFNYGAGKYSRVRKAFFFTLVVGEICVACFAAVGIIYASTLVRFFRADPDVVAIGRFALRVQLLSLLFQPLAVCANMMFQSIGKNASATFLSALRSGLFFIPTIYILTYLLRLTGVEISQSVSDVMSFFMTIPFVIKFFRTLPEDSDKEARLV